MPDALWSLNTREYTALSDVQRQALIQWAIERVWYAEAHRDSSKDSMPWTVDDFLIPGHREARHLEHEQMLREVDKENRRLMAIKKGPPTDDIPDWARPPELRKGA